jgi:hypothetical protein
MFGRPSIEKHISQSHRGKSNNDVIVENVIENRAYARTEFRMLIIVR